jgi:hypothetical protein
MLYPIELRAREHIHIITGRVLERVSETRVTNRLPAPTEPFYDSLRNSWQGENRVKPFSLAIFFLAAAALLNAGDKNDLSTQQPFHSGGSIEIHLQSGDYVISGTDSDSVSVTYGCDSQRLLREVKVSIKVEGSNARISIADTPDNENFHATIEIPRRSALLVRLTAGDLRVQGIEGDKDVEARAGNVEIEVPHPEQYGHRDASVLAGDIDASAFNVSKDGLFRSFHQNGPGKYRLHAHLAAGNLSLIEGD